VKETHGEDLQLVGPSKSLFEKGGSLGVCIPSPIVKHLDLHTRDQLVFVLDRKNRCLIAGKKDSMAIRVGKRKVAFYVPVSRKRLIKITKILQYPNGNRARRRQSRE
jgi:antitoxin component of MazEF toxin-antitoxin module